MPHDKLGKSLAEGDLVSVPCRVTESFPGEGRGCNLTLVALEPSDDSTEYHPIIALNSRSVLKQENPRPEYQQRVIDERKELTGKIEKLETFLNARAGNLAPDEETRMRSQLAAMKSYEGILCERIDNFVF